MKKKIKDLTVSQLYEYCKDKESCDDCPCRRIWYCTMDTPYILEEEALEQEIEIPDELFGISEQLEEGYGTSEIFRKKDGEECD